MKRLALSIILITALVSAAVINANPLTDSAKQLVVKNLLRGINSENQGIRTASAEVIFQLIEQDYLSKDDFTGSVIPLMKMVREGESDIERIAAALALYRIEDGRGIYRLRSVAKYDEEENVRKVSKNLYYQYHMANGTTSFLDF